MVRRLAVAVAGSLLGACKPPTPAELAQQADSWAATVQLVQAERAQARISDVYASQMLRIADEELQTLRQTAERSSKMPRDAREHILRTIAFATARAR